MQTLNEKELMASAAARAMEKPNHHRQQQQQQQQQQALKCPRCNSPNTKFCYYNNYSLLQPRHFCKACKRYWTRGGTLRNVPVGGGCRKNKRIKKPSSSNPNPNPSKNNELASSLSHANPLRYGLPRNPSEGILVYPRYNSRIPEAGAGSGYDLLNDIGVGFSHGTMRCGNILDSSLFFPNHLPFGTTNSCFSSSAMASLLGSSHEKHSLEGFRPCNGGMMTKETKMGEDQTRLIWDYGGQNRIEQIGSLDPNALLWNTASVGAWLDPANIGPSVPSLI